MTERLECEICGDDVSELRWTSQSNSRGKPCSPQCEDCFTPTQIGGDGWAGKCCGVMDGPGFDDLPLAQRGANRPA